MVFRTWMSHTMEGSTSGFFGVLYFHKTGLVRNFGRDNFQAHKTGRENPEAVHGWTATIPREQQKAFLR